MKNRLIATSFIGFSILYLLLILLEKEDVAWFLKPFLLPFLLLLVYFQEYFDSKKTLLIALSLSWLGDILLLFSPQGEVYFIGGLLAFLFSHLFYIWVFNRQLKVNLKKNKFIYWFGITLIITYLIVILAVLMPYLDNLILPVFVYAMVLSIMLLFALKGFGNWHKPASSSILIGAVVFVVSDSILALDKFYVPLQYGSFLIMITYLIAQYLIVFGILKLNNKKLKII